VATAKTCAVQTQETTDETTPLMAEMPLSTRTQPERSNVVWVAYLLTSLFVVAAACSAWISADSRQTHTSWTVDGPRILLNGEPFFIKGVGYSPTPVGGDARFAPNFGDYFDSKWSRLHDRDVPLMRDELKVNAVRCYIWHPESPPTLDDVSSWKNDEDLERFHQRSPTLDHRGLLDQLWNDGKDPIYVLIGIPLSPDWADGNMPPMFYKYYEWVVETLAATDGAHPAVMGFTLGNEINNQERLESEEFWTQTRRLVAAARRGFEARGVKRIVSSGLQDDPGLYDYKSESGVTTVENMAKTFDFWTTNVYDPIEEFIGAIPSSGGVGMPLVLGEFGSPTASETGLLPHNGQAAAERITGIWEAMHERLDLFSGGFAFEFSDEWWKVGHPTNHDFDALPFEDFPGGVWAEEWWGLYSIALDPPDRPAETPWCDEWQVPYTDKLTPRAGAYAVGKLCIPSVDDLKKLPSRTSSTESTESEGGSKRLRR